VCITNLLLYIFILTFAFVNIYKFLIKMEKWRIFLLFMFYLLAVIVAISKLVYFTTEFLIFVNRHFLPKVTFVSTYVGFWSKTILGVF